MDEEEIKQKFEKLWERVKELEAKIGKKEATPEKLRKKGFKEETNIEKFSRSLGINEKALRFKIDFQDEMPRLMEIPKGKTRTKTQYKSLMVLGILYKKIYDQSIDNNKIIRLFHLSKIPTERLDKLYGSPMFNKFFTKSKNEIRFSWAGEKEAEKLIKELIENETNTSK